MNETLGVSAIVERFTEHLKLGEAYVCLSLGYREDLARSSDYFFHILILLVVFYSVSDLVAVSFAVHRNGPKLSLVNTFCILP